MAMLTTLDASGSFSAMDADAVVPPPAKAAHPFAQRTFFGEDELQRGDVRTPAGFHPDETLLRVLGNSPTVAIFRADLRGNLVYANQRFCEMWRLPLHEALGLGWVRRMHPEDRGLLAGWMSPKPRAAFWRLLLPDASVVYLSGQQSILYDEQGRAVGKVGTILDITESEQARRFDAKRGEVLEAVVQNHPTRVPLRLLVEALEEHCPSCSCVLLFNKEDKPFVTVGTRVPARLFELIVTEMEAKTPIWTPRRSDAGLRMVSSPDVRTAQSQLRELVDRADLYCVHELDVRAPGGQLIGSIFMLGREADVLTARHHEVAKEAARLAALAWENRQKFHRLEHRAQHDALTELPNRLGLQEHLSDLVADWTDGRLEAALLCMDVDRFKQINDLLGHSAADQLLQLITTRLRNELGAFDLLARTGGDEFALMLTKVGSAAEAALAAVKIGEAMREPFAFGDHEVSATLSIGISMFPQDGLDVDALLLNAEKAMYRVKANGRDHYEVYRRENEMGMSSKGMEGLLRKALRENLFELLYQPQYTGNGELQAFEALLRLRHEGRLWSPAEFIGVAEESGLIVPIGKWVLLEACRQGERWRVSEGRAIRVAVNVSALQFARADFPQLVMETLRESRLPPHLLELELTETVVMARIEETAEQMRQLAASGVRFAIDDFGTGFSSLHYLHRLPVQTLKIDRSFVTEMLEPAGTGPLVKGIISLAHSLRLEVVAEGVETKEQCEALVVQECDLLQGYYYAEPLGEKRATALFGQGR